MPAAIRGGLLSSDFLASGLVRAYGTVPLLTPGAIRAYARDQATAEIALGPASGARAVLEASTRKVVRWLGWMHDEPAARKQFPHSISAVDPGSVLKYKFQGSVIGVYWVVAPDSGDMEWSVDGNAAKRESSWDKYALRFTRVNYKILDDSLAPGEHELTIKVLAEGQPESKGTWIRIGALLVN